MSDEHTGDAGAGGPWDEVAVDDVRIGDRVRARGAEFTVARIDHPFLGRDEMVCLIEDTPERWHAYPVPRADAIERRAAPD